MEELLKTATEVLARIAEGIAVIVIAVGMLRATVAWVRHLFSHRPGTPLHVSIRLTLGRSLALGLEFLLGADILLTAVSPSWEQIGQLAAIAAIRTALNYFLEQEMRDLDRQATEAP